MAEPVKKQEAAPSPDLKSFDWQDPLDLESQLSEEERMIRDSARAPSRRTSSCRGCSRPSDAKSSTARS